MIKRNTFGYLLVAAILAGSAVWAASAQAEENSGGGYFAWLNGSSDSGSSDSDTDKNPSGAFIPSSPSPAPAAKATNQAPAAQSEDSDAATSPQYTPAQQYTPSPMAPAVINDLGMASSIYAPKPSIPPPADADFSTLKHHPIHGKPAMVYMVEQRIKRAKASVSDKRLSGSERRKNGKNAYKDLSSLENVLHQKQKIPDSIYKSMKMTDQYLQEEKDGDAAALKELDAALQELKDYQ